MAAYRRIMSNLGHPGFDRKGIAMINLDDAEDGSGNWSAPLASASPVR